MDRLDPRAPLVVDTRELGRRPGSLHRVARTVASPAGLGIDVFGVPTGAPLQLDLRLEAVMEGVLVSGTVRGTGTGQCVRCLDAVEQDLEVDLQELYYYPDLARERHDDDEEVLSLEGDMLPLEPVVRDAVVLALPLQPRCVEDCPGLCPDCGVRLADDPAHRHELLDARWAALADVFNASDTARVPDQPSGGLSAADAKQER